MDPIDLLSTGVSSMDPESSDDELARLPENVQPKTSNPQMEGSSVEVDDTKADDGEDGGNGNADDNFMKNDSDIASLLGLGVGNATDNKEVDSAGLSGLGDGGSKEKKELNTVGLPDMTAEGHAAMVSSTLLEFFCLSKAVDHLNKQCGTPGKYSRTCREAQELGQRMFRYQSQCLASRGVLAGGIEGYDFKDLRDYYLDGLDALGDMAIGGLNLNPEQQSLSQGAVEDAETLAGGTLDISVVKQDQQELQGTGNAGLSLQKHITDRPDAEAEAGTGEKEDNETQSPRLPAFRELVQRPPLPPPVVAQPASLQLTNIASPVPQAPHTYAKPADQSRYTMDFEEQCMIGKGGFGAVYKVKHHVDGQVYAVKKIPLSARRLKQLQDGGMRELDNILKEIRTLARLDHQNVVRYFTAWAEYGVSSSTTTTKVAPNVGPEAPAATMTATIDEEEDFSFSGVFEVSKSARIDESDHNIVFEESSKAAVRRGSSLQSITKSSSVRAEKYSDTKAGDDESGDVESVTRRSSLLEPRAIESSDADKDPFTDRTRDDNQKQLYRQVSRSNKSVSAVTLHIQMSLHSLNLAQYLVSYRDAHGAADYPPHCFHIIPSAKILLDILSGVEYLHSKGVVHRDLKPANIFLEPANDVVFHCPQCEENGRPSPCHMVPRIGDFGLVADISADDGDQLKVPVNTRPVGTGFYRPPQQDTEASSTTKIPRVDSTLDIFALGVILLELLYKFETGMERFSALKNLTCSSSIAINWSNLSPMQKRQYDAPDSRLPDSFAEELGLAHELLKDPDETENIVDNITACIYGMVEPDPTRRLTCGAVRRYLEAVCELVNKKGKGYFFCEIPKESED